jgi:malonate-semialdehyde dehydrogenase (acetylating)/methylmalonate-semialdehyde dehydrogenase
VQAAKQAFETWQDVSVVRRARIMFKFRELIDATPTSSRG